MQSSKKRPMIKRKGQMAEEKFKTAIINAFNVLGKEDRRNEQVEN